MKPPTDYEEMTQRIGFYFGTSRKEILEGLTLDEFYSYHRNAQYFYLESQGRPVPKKPSNDQQKQYQADRMARLKKIYGED